MVLPQDPSTNAAPWPRMGLRRTGLATLPLAQFPGVAQPGVRNPAWKRHAANPLLPNGPTCTHQAAAIRQACRARTRFGAHTHFGGMPSERGVAWPCWAPPPGPCTPVRASRVHLHLGPGPLLRIPLSPFGRLSIDACFGMDNGAMALLPSCRLCRVLVSSCPRVHVTAAVCPGPESLLGRAAGGLGGPSKQKPRLGRYGARS